MPFSADYDDVYQLGIKEAANSAGIEAQRVDEQLFSEGMLDRIYRQIEAADMIIADLSSKNANVFYELGFAHGRSKLCILLTKNAEDIPFDLKHMKHVIYGDSVVNLKSQLIPVLEWAKSEGEVRNRSGVEVRIESMFGWLHKTTQFARGDISFKINLHNIGASPVEIYAIYFYSSVQWMVYQEEAAPAPNQDSDLDDFEKQHLIKPPVDRLGASAWAQVKFSARKYFAWATRGDELKDSYEVNGRAVLRIITATGAHDFPFIVKAECDDIPF